MPAVMTLLVISLTNTMMMMKTQAATHPTITAVRNVEEEEE